MTAIKVQPPPPAQAALTRLLTSTDPDQRAQGEALALADPSLMPVWAAWVELLDLEASVSAEKASPQAAAWQRAFDSESQAWLSGRIRLGRPLSVGTHWELEGNACKPERLGGGISLDYSPRLTVGSGDRFLVKRLKPFESQVDYDAPEGLDLWEVWIAGAIVPAPPPWAWRVIVGVE